MWQYRICHWKGHLLQVSLTAKHFDTESHWTFLLTEVFSVTWQIKHEQFLPGFKCAWILVSLKLYVSWMKHGTVYKYCEINCLLLLDMHGISSGRKCMLVVLDKEDGKFGRGWGWGGGVTIRGGNHGEATVTEKRHCHLLGGACLCQTHSLHISHFSIKLCCMIYYVGCRNTFVWRNIWNVHRNAPMPNSFSCFKAALSRIWGL